MRWDACRVLKELVRNLFERSQRLEEVSTHQRKTNIAQSSRMSRWTIGELYNIWPLLQFLGKSCCKTLWSHVWACEEHDCECPSDQPDLLPWWNYLIRRYGENSGCHLSCLWQDFQYDLPQHLYSHYSMAEKNCLDHHAERQCLIVHILLEGWLQVEVLSTHHGTSRV